MASSSTKSLNKSSSKSSSPWQTIKKTATLPFRAVGAVVKFPFKVVGWTGKFVSNHKLLALTVGGGVFGGFTIKESLDKVNHSGETVKVADEQVTRSCDEFPEYEDSGSVDMEYC